MLAGVRTGRPDWVEAGARAQAYAAAKAPDRLSVFESMLIASGYNLLRNRAPATPAFAERRAVWEDYLRTIKPVYNARLDAEHLPSNKYLVEAVAYFELARSGLRSPIPGAVLNRPGEARRRGLDVINRLVPKRVPDAPRARRRAPRHRALGPLQAAARVPQPLARRCWRGRSTSPTARRPARARRRCGSARAACGRSRRPDGDLAYFGRSQGQSWALALAELRRGARRRRALRPPGARVPRRRRARAAPARRAAPDRPHRDGDRAVGQRARDDPGDRRLREPGRLQRPHADGARLGGRGRTRPLRRRQPARRPRRAARRAAVRVGALRDDPARPRLDGREARLAGRATAAPRSGSARSSAAPAAAAGSTSCRRRPPSPGSPRGSFGPALRLRGGALAKPRGRRIEVRRGRIVVRRRLGPPRPLGAPRRHVPLRPDRARRAGRP